MAVKRRALEVWLLANGFALRPGGKTSHRQYVGCGIKVTVPGHGPQDMTPGLVASFRRQLRAAGVSVSDFPGAPPS